MSCGADQMETKAICDDLGIGLIAYSPLGLGMLSGKYGGDRGLPKGPRGLLFRQILPGIEPLLDLLGQIAAKKQATIPQVMVPYIDKHCVFEMVITDVQTYTHRDRPREGERERWGKRRVRRLRGGR